MGVPPLVGCSEDDTCTAGYEGCECSEGSCLSGLSCLSNLCVSASPSNPAVPGDSPDGNQEPEPPMVIGSGGWDSDPPMPDASTTPDCGDTSSDADNCGQCGVRCGEGQICRDWGCVEDVPRLAPCITWGDEITTCEQSCAEAGGTCVQEGCEGRTWFGQGGDQICRFDIEETASRHSCDTESRSRTYDDLGELSSETFSGSRRGTVVLRAATAP